MQLHDARQTSSRNADMATVDVLELATAEAGGHASFEALFAAFQGPIYRYVYRLVGNREDARDLTQDTFVKVYLALPHHRPDHTRSWIYRIATNVCIDALRHRRVVQWCSLDALQEGGQPPEPRPSASRAPHGQTRCGATSGTEGPSVPAPVDAKRAVAVFLAQADPAADPECHALRQECTTEVHMVLERLSPILRAALVLHEYHGLSCKEVGAALGRRRTAVKTLLARGRTQFRLAWAQVHGAPPFAPGGTTAALIAPPA